MNKTSLFLILNLAIISLSCGQDKPAASADILNRYFQSNSAAAAVKLPRVLNEISGLAVSPGGRLFAHDDERGVIFQLDYADGKIISEFYIGRKTIRGDFEGLAIVRANFFLVTSSGTIYQFKEGKQGSRVSYKKYRTFLSSKNNVEGLCYDPNTNSLLLACKGSPGKGYSGYKAIYSFSLEKKKLNKKPRFLLPVKEIAAKINKNITSRMAEILLLKENSFSPSGIERHPKSGNFFIISAKGNRIIIEISPAGRILSSAKLNPKTHKQPECITFLPDQTLIIGDEGGDGKARLTSYILQK